MLPARRLYSLWYAIAGAQWAKYAKYYIARNANLPCSSSYLNKPSIPRWGCWAPFSPPFPKFIPQYQSRQHDWARHVIKRGYLSPNWLTSRFTCLPQRSTRVQVNKHANQHLTRTAKRKTRDVLRRRSSTRPILFTSGAFREPRAWPPAITMQPQSCTYLPACAYCFASARDLDAMIISFFSFFLFLDVLRKSGKFITVRIYSSLPLNNNKC